MDTIMGNLLWLKYECIKEKVNITGYGPKITQEQILIFQLQFSVDDLTI